VTPTVLPDHPEYYVTVAKRIAAAHENAILANQFYNQANPAAHYRTTGPELWEQVAGKLTHLVGGMGTGGTLSGMSRFLKEQNRDIRVIAADPSGSLYKGLKETGQLGTPEPYKVEGVGNDKLPSTCHLDLIDEVRTLADREAFLMARRLSREEGLFVGGSSGLNVAVALQVAREVDDPEALVVVLLCDTGERYLSKLHSDEWMEENGFLERRSHRAADLLTQKKTAPGRLLSATPQTTVRKALADMTQNAVTQLPVLEAGRSLGSVTEANLQARAIEDRISLDLPLSEVMEAPFPLVSENESVERIAAIFSRKNEAILVQRAGEIAASLPAKEAMVTTYMGTAAIGRINKGLDWVIIGGGLTVMQEVFVLKDSPFKTIADLKGKRFASWSTGAGAFKATRAVIMDGFGFDVLKDTKFVQAAAPALIKLLERGDVDSMFNISSLTIAAASQPNKFRSIFAPNDYWKKKTGQPIVWSAPIVAWRSWVDEDRARAKAFVAATHESFRWLRKGKNLDAAVKKFGRLAAVKNQAQADVYKKWLRNKRVFLARWDQEVIDGQWKFLEMAKKHGVLGKLPSKKNHLLILE